jgi:hypothetical protein
VRVLARLPVRVLERGRLQVPARVLERGRLQVVALAVD